MSRASFHDVLVVGTDLAGLMAAGLLQRQKYRCLLLGHGGLRSRFAHDGQPLPAAPLMLPLRGQAPLLDEVLSSLAVEDPVHQLGDGMGVGLQLVTPTRRLDLGPGDERLAAELARGWPEERAAFLARVARARERQAALQALLAERPALPPASLGERLRLRRWRRLLEPPGSPGSTAPGPWRILARAADFLAHLPEGASAPEARDRLVLSMLEGMRFVPDLAERLLDSLGRSGVELHPEAVVEELGAESGRLGLARCARGAGEYRANALLAALPLAELLELVPLGQRKRAARLLADASRPLECVFTSHLVVPARALPVGMGRHVLLVREPQAPLEEDNLVRVQVLPFPGRRERMHVCLSCLVPFRKRALGREHLGPLSKRVFKAAAWLIPFLEEHLEGMASPFWDARGDDPGHPSPWLIHRTLESERPVCLGLGLVPTQPAYRDLWLAGPEVLPALGAEGQAYTALRVAAEVQRRFPLRRAL